MLRGGRVRVGGARLSTRWLLAAQALLGAACGGDGGSGGTLLFDAGVDSAVDELTVESPEAPALPVMTPCAPGWREVVEDGIPTCDPSPESAPEACELGSAQFPGDPGCRRLGAACPADGIVPAERVPAGTHVLYVSADAAAGGTGEAPTSAYSTIGAALTASRPGTVVLVGRGTYREPIVMRPGVSVWGTCPSQVRLTADAGVGLAAVVRGGGPGSVLRDVTVGPAPVVGALLLAGERLRLLGVVITGAAGAAVAAVGGGARVDTLDVVLRETQPWGDGSYGRGLVLQAGAAGQVERALIEQNQDVGVFASGAGTSAVLREVVVRDTDTRVTSGTGGRGMEVQDGAFAVATRTVFERNRGTGVLVGVDGSGALLSDTLVRETLPQRADGDYGRGVAVQERGAVGLRRVWLARNRDLALIASDAGTRASLRDVVVSDTDPTGPDEHGGNGVGVQLGAALDGARVALVRNREFGVSLRGAGVEAALRDVTVRDTTAAASNTGRGFGIDVELGAHAGIARAALERNQAAGFVLSGAESSAEVVDLVVRSTDARIRDGEAGRGIVVQNGARLAATRARLDSNREVGLWIAAGGSVATMTHVAIVDTLERASDGARGGALIVQVDARASLSDVTIERNRDVAVLAIGAGAVAELRRARIVDTRSQACAETTCALAPFGSAMAAAEGGALAVDEFEAQGGPMCGLQLANAQADLSNGLIAGFGVGVCMQTAGYDLQRVAHNVRYRDNRVDLDSTNLPVPTLGLGSGI